jgi:hypothetical protein
VKLVEEHVSHLNNELDNHKEKLIHDKDTMGEQVDSNTRLFEALRDDYFAKTEIIKSISGTTAWLLEAICIKAFLEDVVSEERETEVIRRSQVNITIENSAPSLIRDMTSLTIPGFKNHKVKERQKLQAQDSIDTRNTGYQDIYVYRDVTLEAAESAYYKLINNAANIFNKNVSFKKMGYELQAVFNRALSKKQEPENKAKSQRRNLRYFYIRIVIHIKTIHQFPIKRFLFQSLYNKF